VHLLFPDDQSNAVMQFVENQVKTYCKDGRFIADRVGRGPLPLER
jgi:hypothetical protein